MSATRPERDYVDRIIRTVRQHDSSDESWPQWANLLCDEIEGLRSENQAEQERARTETLAERLHTAAAATVGDPEFLTGSGLVTIRDLLHEAGDEITRLRAIAEEAGLTKMLGQFV
jgi:hypothetical protein